MMPSVRVSLLRRSLLLATLLVAAPVSAAASVDSTGGAALPGGALPSVPDTVPLPVLPNGNATTGTTLPGPDAATQPAEQAAFSERLPRMPVLANVTRRPEDPITEDLAPLSFPTPVVAIDGHVVIVRPHMGRSELVDLADPARERVLLVSTRTFGVPSAGRNAAGQPVIVVSPCAGTDEVVLEGEVPRCPLRVIDLTTGASEPLSSTTGALAGDLAGTRLAFTRASPVDGVRLYLSDGAGATPATLPVLDRGIQAPGKPLRSSVRVPALDVDAAGRLAIVVEHRSKRPIASSSLWLRSAAGAWRRLTSVATTFRGQGTRRVLGPALDGTGVSAYVEGVVDAPSFVAHWSDTAQVTTKTSLRRTIGRSTILASAAFDADRLVFIDWLPGAPCGSEDALACGLRRASPVVIR